MEHRNARKKQHQDCVYGACPPEPREIGERHGRKKSVEGRGDPRADVDRSQPPRHLLRVALGAKADVQKQAHLCDPFLSDMQIALSAACLQVFWFLDAGMTNPSTRCAGRLPKSAKAATPAQVAPARLRMLCNIHLGPH